MSYSVNALPPFESQLKRLVKKYPSLKSEYIELVRKLKEEPVSGIPLGNNCYKIRLAIASKRRGKSGGARVITCIVQAEETIHLLAIYDKSEQENISQQVIDHLLAQIP